MTISRARTHCDEPEVTCRGQTCPCTFCVGNTGLVTPDRPEGAVIGIQGCPAVYSMWVNRLRLPFRARAMPGEYHQMV